MSSVRGPAIGLSVFGVVALCCLSLVMTRVREPVDSADAEYTAVFADVSGLTAGSGVQLAGARIGTVTAIDIADDTTAQLEFSIDRGRSVLDTTHAAVRYQSLLGQYYLELFESRPGGSPLAAGATIPRERTGPGFDVSRLFDGFRPLFTALDVEELGRLAQNVIRVLQGDNAGIGPILTGLGDLLQNATNEHAAVAVLIHNLGKIAAEIGGTVEQVAVLIERIAGLIELFGNAGKLVESLFAEDSTIEGGLLAEPESRIEGDHPSLHEQLQLLASRPDQLVEVLSLKPELIDGLDSDHPAGSTVSATTCPTWPFAPGGLAGTQDRAVCR
ncbi:MlaD family protein [Nocardia sp. NBC_01329]|uniref:MlaD family protein n=1 Tax=Nocardia sp. NBC_01329 TaxID=2903594 RepID=UPI002E10029C|nr:MlaD family protein [Nocardia sp. NBC_01329]